MSLKSYSFLAVALVFFASCSNDKKLPFYGQRETKEVKNADGSVSIDTVYKTIPNWQFLNQDSVLITQSKFENKIYVADFFFTSCTTICPTMHRNMKTIFNTFKDNPDVMFLSHTIDFKYDKPSVLKNYAKKLGVDGPKWQFVYGSKADVYRMAEQDYLVVVNQDGAAPDGFIHQGYLVLIDKHKRIRGAYDGTVKAQVEQLTKDISILLKED